MVHQTTPPPKGVALWHGQSNDGETEVPVMCATGCLRNICQGVMGEITA